MSILVVLAVVLGSALAAPQIPLKPAPLPLPAYSPLAYSAPLASAYKPLPLAPALRNYQPYAAPLVPAVKPLAIAPTLRTALPYAAPLVPAVKPLDPAVRAYPYSPYNPQAIYNGQYVKPVAILRQSQDDNFDGSFVNNFEAENGISSQTSGYVKNAGTDAAAQVMQGQYAYTAPDGTPILTRWWADETGFHAEGAHLPQAPQEPFRTA